MTTDLFTADAVPEGVITCSGCGTVLPDERAMLTHLCPEQSPPLIAEVAKLTLNPGDVLVLRIDTPSLSRDTHDSAKRWLAENLPPGIHTLILSNRESLQVIKAPATEATA